MFPKADVRFPGLGALSPGVLLLAIYEKPCDMSGTVLDACEGDSGIEGVADLFFRTDFGSLDCAVSWGRPAMYSYLGHFDIPSIHVEPGSALRLSPLEHTRRPSVTDRRDSEEESESTAL
ncbi:hypothetical protein MC885_011097 [Smutsia gigantea]|nr:hypothetical protein MC885_011097 [Smutsia gigantea]